MLPNQWIGTLGLLLLCCFAPKFGAAQAEGKAQKQNVQNAERTTATPDRTAAATSGRKAHRANDRAAAAAATDTPPPVTYHFDRQYSINIDAAASSPEEIDLFLSQLELVIRKLRNTFGFEIGPIDLYCRVDPGQLKKQAPTRPVTGLEDTIKLQYFDIGQELKISSEPFSPDKVLRNEWDYTLFRLALLQRALREKMPDHFQNTNVKLLAGQDDLPQLSYRISAGFPAGFLDEYLLVAELDKGISGLLQQEFDNIYDLAGEVTEEGIFLRFRDYNSEYDSEGIHNLAVQIYSIIYHHLAEIDHIELRHTTYEQASYWESATSVRYDGEEVQLPYSLNGAPASLVLGKKGAEAAGLSTLEVELAKLHYLAKQLHLHEKDPVLHIINDPNAEDILTEVKIMLKRADHARSR